MTECDTDGGSATFEGLLTLYRIDRENDCNTVQQSRSKFVFVEDDNQWLASQLLFFGEPLPNTCSA